MSIFEIADQYLDANDFARARDAYREAIASDIRHDALANLRTAETQESIAYRRDLVARNPSSLEARLEFARAYLHGHMASQAVRVCTELLDLVVASDDIATRSRIIRYKAAVRAQQWHVASDDFVYVWRLCDKEHSREIRKTLLRELASIDRATPESFFANVAAALPAEPHLSEFIDAKVTELRALARLGEEIDG